MTTTVDLDYYEWLIDQIDIPNGKSYRDLFECMHNIEFVWTIPNDDNRVQDGLDLRSEFADGTVGGVTSGGATILEILVALSRRVAFATDGDPRQWAWRLLKNLRLHKMHDPLTGAKKLRANDILDALVWRTYERDGRGGFFPLNYPEEDQTKVEIWDQMNKYVMELHLLG
jgi:hypothetical protein